MGQKSLGGNFVKMMGDGWKNIGVNLVNSMGEKRFVKKVSVKTL